MTFQNQSARTRTDSNGNHPKHYAKVQVRLARIHAAGLRIWEMILLISKLLLEISIFLRFEFVMRPKGIVESKVTVLFLRVIRVK